MFLAPYVLLAAQDPAPDDRPKLPLEDLRAAARVIGVEYTDSELELLSAGAAESLAAFDKLRSLELANSVAPALIFRARIPGVASPRPWPASIARTLPEARRPADLEELAFADIPTLAELVRTRAVSCLELTDMYLARLERLDPLLLCTVTLCKERARARARGLDLELAAGQWRGPLHGIPWGAKDLLATRGEHTTWGTPPFRDQVIDADAAVVEKLDAAGAVLIAKLSLGELAWGDVWFGGTTKNPWKPSTGSSGSSAGPASATAAGCVAFAIGSETCGSIVSPTATCGATGLRPTFGRVSRRGAMQLAASMDKLGPICRSVEDAAIVFAAIQGADPLDESSVTEPWVDLGPVDVRGWKVGYVAGAWRDPEAERRRLDELAALGVALCPIELPRFPVFELLTILSCEAAATFDAFERAGLDDRMVRQEEQAWPNVFRGARFVSAVDYLRANRIRRQLMIDMSRIYAEIDVFVHPSRDDYVLVLENLTGHPTVCIPTELGKDGLPGSLSFSAAVFDEPRALALAEAWQRATGHHLRHPELAAPVSGR